MTIRLKKAQGTYEVLKTVRSTTTDLRLPESQLAQKGTSHMPRMCLTKNAFPRRENAFPHGANRSDADQFASLKITFLR